MRAIGTKGYALIWTFDEIVHHAHAAGRTDGVVFSFCGLLVNLGMKNEPNATRGMWLDDPLRAPTCLKCSVTSSVEEGPWYGR